VRLEEGASAGYDLVTVDDSGDTDDHRGDGDSNRAGRTAGGGRRDRSRRHPR
jgi:hypothetical protein